MEATVSMGNILDFINSMSLSASSKKWLGKKLIEEAEREEAVAKKAKLTFKDKGISSGVANMRRGISGLENMDTDDIRLEYLKKKYL